jgi:stage V sporulation protein D (sporulation-specific penicillin-binding protein)
MQSFNAIANGGTLIQPHIMKEISYDEENGTKVIDEKFEPTKKTNIISESTAATLRNYLERTMNQGTQIGAFMGKERRVGGKSGTAQTVDPITGGYSADKYIASIIALYPVEKPEVTIFLKVENPSTGVYYGGQVATPLLKTLLTEMFKYMDSQIYKDRYTETKKVVVPELRGKTIEEAKEILSNNNLNMTIEVNEGKVTNMEPYPGSLVEEKSIVTINLKENKKDSSKVLMPNLKGKTLDEAIEILNKIGITDYKTNGEGTVKNQDVIPGKIIEKTTKVKLDLNN